jgi:hypothetical protein
MPVIAAAGTALPEVRAGGLVVIFFRAARQSNSAGLRHRSL